MVTITGNAGRLATGGFGIVGVTGTLELVVKHPSGTVPVHPTSDAVMAEDSPLLITTLPIAAATTVYPSSGFLPAGCYHTATWRLNITSGPKAGTIEVITYDVWIGPEGGTCDLTDPVNRVSHLDAPALSGWPDVAPVPVYSAVGTP